MRTPGPWHLFTNRHPERNGDPWGVVEAVRHPAGGTGKMPSGMTITWTGPIGRDNAAFIVEACNNYEAVCAERDKLLAESEETECLQGEQDKFAREANEQITALKQERDRLKAALEWYRDNSGSQAADIDCGRRAHAALSPTQEAGE